MKAIPRAASGVTATVYLFSRTFLGLPQATLGKQVSCHRNSLIPAPLSATPHRTITSVAAA
jgi:hypothetical protein